MDVEAAYQLEVPFVLRNGSFGAEKNDGFEGNLRLLFTGAYADCTVSCRDQKWKTHQSILCPRNAYFRSALDGNFRESKTKTIELGDDEEPWAVEGLLIFLCTAQYPLDFIRCPIPESRFETHLKLFQIGDKRRADALRIRAGNSLADSLNECTDKAKFLEMVEQIRVTKVPIPLSIGRAAARMVIKDIGASFSINTFRSEECLELGMVSELLDILHRQKTSTREAAQMANQLWRTTCVEHVLRNEDRRRICDLHSLCQKLAE